MNSFFRILLTKEESETYKSEAACIFDRAAHLRNCSNSTIISLVSFFIILPLLQSYAIQVDFIFFIFWNISLCCYFICYRKKLVAFLCTKFETEINCIALKFATLNAALTKKNPVISFKWNSSSFIVFLLFFIPKTLSVRTPFYFRRKKLRMLNITLIDFEVYWGENVCCWAMRKHNRPIDL